MSFKYNPGDRIGPYNILFLKRTEKKGKNKVWYGLFECPICKEPFESQLGNVQSGASKKCQKCRSNKVIFSSGDKIDAWTVITEDKERTEKEKSTYYWCECECGKIKSVKGIALKQHESKSCGCKNLKYPKNLSGQKIAEWEVLYPIDSHGVKTNNVTTNQNYLCRCSCGKEEMLSRNTLIVEAKKSCGHKYNLIGKKFGRLTVLTQDKKQSRQKNTKWICICDCGKFTSVSTTNLLNGRTVSCGCYRDERVRETNCKDITGQRFGKLTALYDTGVTSKHKQGHIWHFRCDCGNEKDIPLSRVLSGQTNSCGCYLKSKGEYRIEEILNHLSISYKNQKTFENCRNPRTKALLYFDFYLPDHNCCIEYDGRQHFCDINVGWEKEKIEVRQFRDKIKNQYCKKNKIKLIRIPYWDYKNLSEEYLKKALQCPLMNFSNNIDNKIN